ncbi:hypothetical protein SLS62_005055 [Diatrype stigma]|uniref:Xylanolytic transcriptional activator regulatory domain-containing protein n=1 Tax=Diatrype stigma TaxID=117547 RepID=A0AAN9UT50_9PEZI
MSGPEVVDGNPPRDMVMHGDANAERENENDDRNSFDNHKHDEGSRDQQDTQSKGPPRKRRRLTRNKESSCQYETGRPVRKDSRNEPVRSDEDRSPPQTEEQRTSAPHKAVDFGYTNNGSSPLEILKKIDGTGGESIPGMPADTYDRDSVGVRERYKSLVRQLPARTFVDQLIAVYSRDINWQYCGLDIPILQDLVDQWYNLPFSLLSSAGPQALDPMLRALPALLFQLMASALLYVPDSAHETFNSLKYANMTFDDLALEYSESGVAILSLLGKRQMSIVTVLAGWVRAGFLKYTGQVTESWHQVGTAIRDAQEIGLHRDQYDPQPTPDDDSDTILHKLWMSQFRRRVWMTLLSWDLHTGAVLGRPTSIDFRQINRSMPIDVVLPNEKKKMPLVPRGEGDPPTPLTRAIWGFELMRPLREILDLEKEGPFPKDFTKVDRLHQKLLDIQASTPAPFRLENPDTRFDDRPECWWLPLVRPNLPQLMAFNFMALHRPYIFTRAASRHEALKASLGMLEAQRIYFSVMKPHQFRTFGLFFGTFDAVVMLASIYILFPREHVELLPTAVQHFRWAVERFERMAERNRLAQAALGVLRAIYIRFKKAVGAQFSCEQICRGIDIAAGSLTLGVSCPPGVNNNTNNNHTTTPGSVSDAMSTTLTNNSHSSSDASRHPSTASSSGGGGGVNSATTSTVPASRSSLDGGSISGGSAGPTPAASGKSAADAAASAGGDITNSTGNIFDTPAGAATDWTFPADFDFSTIMPMYPMGDVAYNDLTGVLAGTDGNANHNGNNDIIHHNGGGGGWSDATLSPGTALHTMQSTPAATTPGHNNNSGINNNGGSFLQEQDQEQPWLFGGDFGNDTIWNLLNQFPSY